MPLTTSVAAALTAANGLDLTLFKHLRPCIVGSKALLHRYAVPSERTGILVDYYNSALNETYSYPGKLTDSIVDQSYTKVWIENALLKYLDRTVGVSGTVTMPTSQTNRVRASGYVFQTANGTSRTGVFGDRDVTVGDIVHVKATISSVLYELWTSVTGLVADVTAASVSAATSDVNNSALQFEAAPISQVNGTPANEVVAVADGSAYDSMADGYITRTYTITCTQSSTGSNATTALLNVTSADGLDNVSNVVPSAFGSQTLIGTHGLKVTFSLDGSRVSISSGTSGSISHTDFVVGQQWTCTVKMDFTPPVPTSGGTYNGATSTTYIVKVSLGGDYSDTTQPQVTVTSTTGVDQSGPTTVTATNTAVTIGTQGTTIKFNGSYLRKGDIYYVPVVAAVPGAVRTIVLGNNLPTQLQTATDMDLQLFIRIPIVQVPINQLLPSPTTNYVVSASNVVVNAGLQMTTTGLTSGGSQLYVPVVSGNGNGKLYIEYREWDITLAGTIYTFNTRAQIAATLGTVDPDNPVAFGADVAVQQTATAVLGAAANPGAPSSTDNVKVVILDGDPATQTPWTDALSLLTGEDDIYNIVPMSNDPGVQTQVANHVVAQSDPLVQQFRACFLQGTVKQTLAILSSATTSDLTAALATLTQNPNVITTAYTYLQVPAGNAMFITNGVRAGDAVRYQYSIDAFGNATYTTYTVASVVSENTLILVSGSGSSIGTAQRVEVWRTPTSTELAQQVITQASGFANTRICLMWPDQVTVVNSLGNLVSVPGYFACAAVAGLTGSMPSHQGLRNMQVLGIVAAPRSRTFLQTAQLDSMGSNGVWVIDQAADGTIYTRWAVTTDPTIAATREEMYRRNYDNFQLDLLKDIWGGFIGVANATSFIIASMRSKANAFVARMRTSAFTQKLGPPVVSVTITNLAISDTLPDHMAATISFVGPYPDNENELTLVI